MTAALKNARRIAFQGETGAYANLAAQQAVPHAAAIPRPTFEDAIAAARAGDTDLCIIPVENSLIGRIADIHHLLPDSGLHIVGEHFLPIRHQLMGLPDATPDGITAVYSQAPALAQCRNLIRDRRLVAHNWYDTAGSARHVAELGDTSVAAIASSLAAEFYGLKILQADVEDEHHNATRFLIMSPRDERAANNGKVVTTLMFQVKNAPAALYKALGAFATNGINITKLESYISGAAFEAAQFYAEIEGHPEQRNVRLAFEELGFFSREVKVLGVFPTHPFRREGWKDPTKG